MKVYDKIKIVEEILTHEGNTRKNIKFYVKWKEFSNKRDYWEAWEVMKDIQIVHEYLINNGLQKLILKKYWRKYPLINFE